MFYVLLKRPEPYAEIIVGDHQCGFRRNRSTADQIFLLRQLMEKKWEYAEEIHTLDFAKAYDSIARHALINILYSLLAFQHDSSSYQGCGPVVRVTTEFTRESEIERGLKQGGALTLMLLNWTYRV